MVIARISNLLGKITIFFVICCLVIGSFVVNTAVALDGSGTEQDPWRIKSLDDFNDFAADANYWDDFTRLETDVNLVGRVYDRAVIYSFSGVFDGNNHTISNFTYDSNRVHYNIGLFGYVNDPHAEIKNLGLIDPNVDVGAGSDVGSLVGLLREGTVNTCYVKGGSVSGKFGVGGLVGDNSGTIANCFTTGSVSGDISVGGLVGENRGFIAPGQPPRYGTISNCYSMSSVLGTTHVGGLVGWNYGNTITNCYSTGDVSGTGFVGGLVGDNGDTTSNCFWDIETSGQTTSAGGTGKTTAEMQMQIIFTDASWDFINVWNIGENQTYPYLRKYLPANLNKDHKVDFLDIRILCEQWLEKE